MHFGSQEMCRNCPTDLLRSALNQWQLPGPHGQACSSRTFPPFTLLHLCLEVSWSLPNSWVFKCFTPLYSKLLQKAAEVHKYWALCSVWMCFLLKGTVSHGCFWGHCHERLHWERELLPKAQSYSFGTTAIWNSLKREQQILFKQALGSGSDTNHSFRLNQSTELEHSQVQEKQIDYKSRPEHHCSEPVWTHASVLRIHCIMSKQDIGKWVQAAAEHIGSHAGGGMVAASTAAKSSLCTGPW